MRIAPQHSLSPPILRRTTHGAWYVLRAHSWTRATAPKLSEGWRWHKCTRRLWNCHACHLDVPTTAFWTEDATIAVQLAALAPIEFRAPLLAAAAHYQENLTLSRAHDSPLEIPCPTGLAYLPYQRAGIAYALRQKCTLIADEMGLGKTIQAIGLINHDPDIRRILILCPASLRLNWQRELHRWLVRSFEFHVVNGGRLPPLTPGLFGHGYIAIANYDQLVTAKHSAWLRAGLAALAWDLVIADEAHYLKTPKSGRTKAVLGDPDPRKPVPGAIAKAKRALFLTGTPILNRPAELWPLAHRLAPERFNSWQRFQTRYCWNDEADRPDPRKGASNLDELQHALRSTIMIRRLKSDVLKELPPRRHQMIPLDAAGHEPLIQQEIALANQIQEKIRVARADMAAARASGNDDAHRARVKKLQSDIGPLQAHVSIVRHQLGLAKVPLVIAHIKDLLDSGECDKLIVFAHHRDVNNELYGAFLGRAVRLIGGLSEHDRDNAVQRFQNDPTINLFVGSIDAAGLGLTLTAASTVLFAEQAWTPGAMTQAIDRTHRIGQKNTVLAQYLVFDGSLDAKMAQTLVEKGEIIEAALDLCPPSDQP